VNWIFFLFTVIEGSIELSSPKFSGFLCRYYGYVVDIGEPVASVIASELAEHLVKLLVAIVILGELAKSQQNNS